jgi:glycosyltransferase involved in cell wall biosynthesis
MDGAHLTGGVGPGLRGPDPVSGSRGESYDAVVHQRPGRLTDTLPAKLRVENQAHGPSARTLRIAIVSQYVPPEIGATQARMQTFAEYLALRGHSVTVICEQPNHPLGVISTDYKGMLVEDDLWNDYRVLRVWVKANPMKTQATRIAFYLSFSAMAVAVAPLVGPVDVVLATTPPLFTGAAGLALARLNRAPLVLDVRDLWPAAAVSLEQIGGGVPLHLAEWLEQHLYDRAAAVTAVTRPFCAHIDSLRKHGRRTILVPNGTLDVFFGEGPIERLAGPDEFLLTFAGTHGIAQALPSVLDAAGLVEGVARFAFVGDGPVKARLAKDAAARKLANVDFYPQRPLEAVLPVLRGSDALLVPLSGHPTFADFVPSKMIDFMATGRPVILAAQGESARILAAAGGGIAVPPEDHGALAQAVRWLAEHPADAAEMGRKGKAFARKRLRQVQARRLEEVLLDCVEPG